MEFAFLALKSLFIVRMNALILAKNPIHYSSGNLIEEDCDVHKLYLELETPWFYMQRLVHLVTPSKYMSTTPNMMLPVEKTFVTSANLLPIFPFISMFPSTLPQMIWNNNPLTANTTKWPNTFKPFVTIADALFECVWPFWAVDA